MKTEKFKLKLKPSAILKQYAYAVMYVGYTTEHSNNTDATTTCTTVTSTTHIII